MSLIPSLLVLAVLAGLGAALTLLLRRRKRSGGEAVTPESSTWRPTVQHREIPPPAEDPPIAWAAPDIDRIRPDAPPLAGEAIASALRAALDGYALGRVKRILEAPDLLQHAAADAESWPVVEATLERALALAEERGVAIDAKGRPALTRALALCTAQGVLLAEWRQLEDGKTVWANDVARVRASDAFAIQPVTDGVGSER